MQGRKLMTVAEVEGGEGINPGGEVGKSRVTRREKASKRDKKGTKTHIYHRQQQEEEEEEHEEQEEEQECQCL